MASNNTEERGIHNSWIENAKFWDDTVGLDGNQYWKRLQMPSLERLVPLTSGCKALDLATGNGLVARWLASKGADVTAADGSKTMIEHAIQRSSADCADRIAFQVLDVTYPEAFETFLQTEPASQGFDAVTCNMALMDISDIEPLANALPKLLKKDGVFYASMLHPVFFTSGATKFVEVVTNEETGEYYPTRGKVIRQYRYKAPWKGVAVNGQPAAQLYHHRPLDELFGTFFKAGLLMDKLEELYFEKEDANKTRAESSANFTEIPVLMAFRFRRAI